VGQAPRRDRLRPIRARRRQLPSRRLCRPILIRRVSEFSAVARLRPAFPRGRTRPWCRWSHRREAV